MCRWSPGAQPGQIHPLPGKNELRAQAAWWLVRVLQQGTGGVPTANPSLCPLCKVDNTCLETQALGSLLRVGQALSSRPKSQRINPDHKTPSGGSWGGPGSHTPAASESQGPRSLQTDSWAHPRVSQRICISKNFPVGAELVRAQADPVCGKGLGVWCLITGQNLSQPGPECRDLLILPRPCGVACPHHSSAAPWSLVPVQRQGLDREADLQQQDLTGSS